MSADTAYHGELGEQFAALATDNVHNAHTDRPAMLRLAGDVTGTRVLDIGCGAGHYGAELLKRGAARFTGIDGSETLLDAARQRLGDDAILHCHDLEQPLTFLADHSFDLAVMALVYHHVAARGQLLAEIRRVLRPGGRLLVSTTHPTGDWIHFGGSIRSDTRSPGIARTSWPSRSVAPDRRRDPRNADAPRTGDRDTIFLRSGKIWAKTLRRPDHEV
ncbi:class I SAM-dependent methyltransferase [Nocardia noduli]|uniref:class I SAM-dependent methyltransferase n=1 Tax=Nocardia noduli TaxID=2815722 RepID=UPI001C233446|nr:class I SAM-dependent methyltransferase [Nocardia noduli]